MSSQTLPISPAAFAAALSSLPLSTLHLKAAELRNSIAHLDYSNEQLRPFADGTEPGLSAPDRDCVEAIRENEKVVERMVERLGLLKQEVEGRGGLWGEFQSAEEVKEALGVGEAEGEAQAHGEQNGTSEAWRDGTFQTGRIVDGEVRMDSAAAHSTNGTTSSANGVTTNGVNGSTGGRLDDEALRRAMDERMLEDGEGEDGMHL
jgi:hypothetical protein